MDTLEQLSEKFAHPDNQRTISLVIGFMQTIDIKLRMLENAMMAAETMIDSDGLQKNAGYQYVKGQHAAYLNIFNAMFAACEVLGGKNFLKDIEEKYQSEAKVDRSKMN